VIVMDASVAEVTVSVEVPEMPPSVAVMIVWPGAMGVARPLDPAALPTDAIPVSDELQVTRDVRSCTEPSEKFPLAENCWISPIGMLGSAGATSIETSTAELTVRSVLPETPPSVAVIVVSPAPMEVASPLEPGVLLTVATAVFDELQVTSEVRSSVVLSE
jgi:hypothetical protein